MKLIGFNFNKINIEKFLNKSQELKINTGIDISKISEIQTGVFKTNEGVLEVGFDYFINYEPNFAKIEFSGSLLVSIDPKMAKDVLKNWKDKKIPDGFRVDLFNLIMRKSSIRALEFEEEMNLPYHIPIPTLKNSENSTDD